MFEHTPEQARKLWVEALRSGEYEQGRGRLFQHNHYCCLGLATELFIKYEGEGRRVDNQFFIDSQNHIHYLPPKVVKWLGLTSNDGEFRKDGISCSLAHKNDAGFSFGEIADIIESEPEGLTVVPKALGKKEE